MSNATAQGVTLTEISIDLEGDIDTGAVWGTGNTGDDVSAGFTAVRVRTTLKGDASPEELTALEKNAIKWSPVVNTFTNPVQFTSELLTE